MTRQCSSFTTQSESGHSYQCPLSKTLYQISVITILQEKESYSFPPARVFSKTCLPESEVEGPNDGTATASYEL